MDLDDQTIGPRCDRRQRDRRDEIPSSRSVRGIRDDRQVPPQLELGDRDDVEAVPRGGLERPAAAFAGRNVRGTRSEQEVRRLQHLLDRRRYPSLEEDRTS